MPDMRVDPAHRMGYASGESEKEPLQVLLEAIAGRNRQYSPQQSERQAQDLGEFLAQQQNDMVSREAELQARLAQLEQESELVRDTLRERERELAEQLEAQRMTYRETPPSETFASVADPALETRQAWKSTLRQTYGSGAGHVRPAQTRTASPGPNTKHRDAASHRETVSPPSREGSTWGTPDLRGVWQPPHPAARAPVDTGKPPLPERGLPREMPREVSTHVAEELNADRMSLEAREAAMEQAWEARRGQIQAMQQELSERRQQLEQFQLETEGLYQTSLEMRMVSEQLWSQVLTAVPSATATQRLRGLRQQLESFLANAERRLEDRRDEVRHAARQLEQQQEKLQENRRIFDAWMRERYRQLDEQTARLAAREREMLSGSAGR